MNTSSPTTAKHVPTTTSQEQTSDQQDNRLQLSTATETGSLANTEQRSATVTVVLSQILKESHPVPRWGINE